MSKSTITSSPNVPVGIEQPGQPTVIISPKVLSKIQLFCRKVPNLEWAGVLFYTFEGELTRPDEIICRVEDVFMTTIDSSGHFNVSWDDTGLAGEVLQYQIEHELLEYRQGLIHSHHNMGVFFSGDNHTQSGNNDMYELRKNAMANYVYLSLVYNNAGDMVGKLAYPVTSTSSIIHKSGKLLKDELEDTCVWHHNCEIEFSSMIDPADEARIDELIERRKKSRTPYHAIAAPSTQSRFDFEQPAVVEEEPTPEWVIMRAALIDLLDTKLGSHKSFWQIEREYMPTLITRQATEERIRQLLEFFGEEITKAYPSIDEKDFADFLEDQVPEYYRPRKNMMDLITEFAGALRRHITN